MVIPCSSYRRLERTQVVCLEKSISAGGAPSPSDAFRVDAVEDHALSGRCAADSLGNGQVFKPVRSDNLSTFILAEVFVLNRHRFIRYFYNLPPAHDFIL